MHLQKISDRAAGWGYSAVTLIAFLTTLWIGLFKVGSAPVPQTEYFGEAFATVPLESLPVSQVTGTIPTRGDGEPLPKSVRVTQPPQLTEVDGQLQFRGWMNADQRTDLLNYAQTLQWQSQVETLAAAATPPAALAGKVKYYPQYGSLGFRGMMTADDRAALENVLANGAATEATLETLWERTHRETTLEGAQPPDRFQIPRAYSERVTLEGDRLTLMGPMSEALREEMAIAWTRPERVRPVTAEQRATFTAALEALGQPLTAEQTAVLEVEFNAIWTPEMLILALDTAGLAPVETKSATELLAERDAGEVNLNPLKPAGDDVVLTPGQREAVGRFSLNASITVEDLRTELEALGPFLPAQEAALKAFLGQQPTLAELQRRVAMGLLQLHRTTPGEPRPTDAQIDFLLEDSREQARWQRQVDELFRRAHTPKFPWAGAYDSPGSPFDWIYAYVFQPVTATMFAMLAFYVASAAFRAFRAKNFEAILLLGTAFLILLMQTFLGAKLTAWAPDWLSALRADEIKRYIMVIFNTAGNRAIMIGIALGVVATSLKILLGVDRSYLGSGDE